MSTKKLSPKENAVQVAKFVAFSLGAGIIQSVTFALINELFEVSYWTAYLPALILSVLYNFTVNRRYTFKSANNVPVAMLKVACYYAVFTPISTLAGDAVAAAFPGNELVDYLVLGVTMLTNLSTEYLFCRFVVYRKSINTNKLAEKSKQADEICQEPANK